MANKKLQALQRSLRKQFKERSSQPLSTPRMDGLKNFGSCLHPGAFALKQCIELDDEERLLCSYSERCDFEGKGDYKRFKLSGKGA